MNAGTRKNGKRERERKFFFSLWYFKYEKTKNKTHQIKNQRSSVNDSACSMGQIAGCTKALKIFQDPLIRRLSDYQ